MSKVFGVLFILAGIVFAIYLGIYVMLWGGISQAVSNWGISSSDVAWGIIKVLFFEAGLLPGATFIGIGCVYVEDK